MASVASSDSSASSSQDGHSSDEEYERLQQEWDESLHQLQLLASVVLLPFVGKYLGRKWSHWVYARYLRLGLGSAFFLGENKLVL